jgi:hypothetical protein
MLSHKIFIEEGRRQRAGGRRKTALSNNYRDHREQGFKTPTEREFSGSKSVGVESPTEKLLLPPASCLLPPSIYIFTSKGKITVKVEPTPTSEARLMSPCNSFTKRETMANPNPVLWGR